MKPRSTIPEAFRLNLRCFRLLRKHCPGLFISAAVRYGLQALLPYAGIYFSTRIIDELAGTKNPDRLRFLVTLTLGITLILLLCRLYDPTEGEILLNGIDIRKYRYDDYLSVFSVVFQDFQLLSFPLGQNVAAMQDYDRERAEDCLKKVGFGERLAKMPKGLDTCLYKDFEQEGVDVSGGEAQKIAIARALYKDAPFIILDEPTAALDPIAEAEVYARFDEIAGDKTAIYISHRLSSCRFCDEIAVFDAGRVIQQGNHETLVADTGGKYYELWQAQAQYYAPSAGEQASGK